MRGAGSGLGPDLTEIGERRSAEFLQESILRPEHNVLPRHWRVQAVAKDGKRYTGTRLNEDTYSLQLRQDDGRLVALMKEDLTEFRLDKSTSMPSYADRLVEAEVNALVAYLSTLEGRDPE
jgi:putative heme-binding domain-containing protein